MTYCTYRRGEFLVTTDPARLDIDFIHGYLVRSYWSEGIPREIVERSLANSLCFSVHQAEMPVGFARAITDYATFAYLADVFIIESHRGRKLAKFLMKCIIQHPQLQGLRRWTLATRDAHELYAQYGFRRLSNPGRFMEIHHPEAYKRSL